MTAGSILFGLALLLLVVLFLMRPFLMPASNQDILASDEEQQRLLAEKEAYISQIRSLDFDYETGKVQEAIYQPQRQQLLVGAAVVLQKLDQIEGNHSQQTSKIDAEIEAAIRALRQGQAFVSPDSADCPQCGQSVSHDDKFCRSCGQLLHATQSTPTTP